MSDQDISKICFGHLADADEGMVAILDRWYERVDILQARRVSSINELEISKLGIEIDTLEACYNELESLHSKVGLAITALTEN